MNSYLLLGIEPTATEEEIKRAYRRKSKLVHPDTGGSAEKQIELNRACEVLLNRRLRSRHDRFWRIITHKKSHTQSASSASSVSSGTAAHATPPECEQTASDIYTGFNDRIKETRKAETERLQQSAEAGFRQELDGFLSTFRKARLIFTAALALLPMMLVLGFFVRFLWGGIVVCLYILYRSRECRLGDCELFVFDADWKRKMEVAARKKIRSGHEKALANVSSKYTALHRCLGLLRKPVRYTDKESDIVLRLILAFFLTGYVPQEFQPGKRLLIAAGAKEQIVIRFRHRKGLPAKVTFVSELYQEMCRRQASRGFLFVTPGFSAPASAFARTHCITLYALDELNDWLDDISRQKYPGEMDDSLARMEQLAAFLTRLDQAEVLS